MSQRIYEVTDLPETGIAASAAFHRDHLEAVRRAAAECDALAIALPPAGSDHDDWRRAMARDLARAHAPVRVNIVAGRPGNARDRLLRYLSGAKGVTGHYLEARD